MRYNILALCSYHTYLGSHEKHPAGDDKKFLNAYQPIPGKLPRIEVYSPFDTHLNWSP